MPVRGHPPAGDQGQSKDIETMTLDGIAAVSFFVSEPTSNGVFHVVQTQNPKIEVAMAVDGMGQGEKFTHVLTTFKFIK